MKISIIIPVFNMQKYLERVLCGVVGSINRYNGDVRAEIVLVDDASVDASKDVIANFEAPNCDVVKKSHSVNMGVGAARQTGVENSTGDYIVWVDPDDTVEPQWFSRLASSIEVGEDASLPDVVTYDAYQTWDSGRFSGDIVYGRKKGRISSRLFARDVIGCRNTGGWLWLRMIRRGFYSGKKISGDCYEDYRVLTEILPETEKVIYLPEKIYHYRRHETSSSRHYNKTPGENALLELVRRACLEVPRQWRGEYLKGVTVLAVDYSRAAGGCSSLRGFIRKNAWRVIVDSKISLRIKIKTLIESVR